MLREIVGHREQAREEPRVMASDQLGQAWVGTHGEQAKGHLEGAQRGGELLRLQVGVATGRVREAAPEARTFDPRHGRRNQRTREQGDETDDERDGHGQQHQRDEDGRHPGGPTVGQGRGRDKPSRLRARESQSRTR